MIIDFQTAQTSKKAEKKLRYIITIDEQETPLYTSKELKKGVITIESIYCRELKVRRLPRISPLRSRPLQQASPIWFVSQGGIPRDWAVAPKLLAATPAIIPYGSLLL